MTCSRHFITHTSDWARYTSDFTEPTFRPAQKQSTWRALPTTNQASTSHCKTQRMHPITCSTHPTHPTHLPTPIGTHITSNSCQKRQNCTATCTWRTLPSSNQASPPHCKTQEMHRITCSTHPTHPTHLPTPQFHVLTSLCHFVVFLAVRFSSVKSMLCELPMH